MTTAEFRNHYTKTTVEWLKLKKRMPELSHRTRCLHSQKRVHEEIEMTCLKVKGEGK